MTIYLVRHAHAGRRADWSGIDAERPLSEKGRHQTEALARHLDGVPLDRVLSSAAVRCRQTVEDLAGRRGLEVETHPALLEGATARSTLALIEELLEAGVDAALSSHGDVIPTTLEVLGTRGVDVGERRGLPKGTYYRLDVDDGAVTSATFVDPRP